MAVIKRQNHQLRRQVSQLRKELERRPAPEDEAKVEALDTPPSEPVCQVCGSADLLSFITPGGVKVTACRDCTWRG